MYLPGLDFYVPKAKYEYVNYFYSKYPHSKKSTFSRMSLPRLKAIYYAIRTRKG